MRARRLEKVGKQKSSSTNIEDVRRRVAGELLEMNLRDFRESLGKTQDETAILAELSQSQLSKIERRKDHLVSTLRRYVAALGGDLEIVALVGNKRIALRDV
ncbi:MAG TPA: helix-turn-helix transcriptional regulator [Polyangia bacterium]|jgi:transcriptional regulator with XRE-family HTH domain|nr:helix-turn-helix transcriptional regulator [Polyangia bacterium]